MPTSVVVKQGHRNTRGKLFIYLWKGMIAPLAGIIDTQCGFKGFSAETVREITDGLSFGAISYAFAAGALG